MSNWVLVSSPFIIHWEDDDDEWNAAAWEEGVLNRLYICSFNITSLESIFCAIVLDDDKIVLQKWMGFKSDCEKEEDGIDE